MHSNKTGVRDVKQIFNVVQQSSLSHLKWSLVLKTALEKNDNEELLTEFDRCLKITLFTDYKVQKVYVTKVISFIAQLCNAFKTKSDSPQLHPFLQHVFTLLIKFSHLNYESCRFLACTLINNIFYNLEELDESLYEEIRNAMFERLQDCKSTIRSEAVTALYRLQDPNDAADPIIMEFSKMMGSDSNGKVRLICVEKIALTNSVLPILIQRIRDVDVSVRLAAFKKVTPIVKCLKIADRRYILKCGFLESSRQIKTYAETVLLKSWLEIYDHNFLKLMASIRFDACEEDIYITVFLAEKMLRALFKGASLAIIVGHIKMNSEKMIEYKDLSWEIVLYYRIVVEYLRESDGFEDILNSILPELVDFCKYIRGYCQYVTIDEEYYILEYYFTLKQFFIITKGYDVGDEASRKCLNSLVHDMLQNTELPTDLAELVVSNLEKTIPDVTARSIFVCEIISNIMHGDTTDYEEFAAQAEERQHAISQLQSEVFTLQECENQCVSEKKFLEAQKIKQQLDEKRTHIERLKLASEAPERSQKKTDVPTLTKCLTVAEGLLMSPTIVTFNPVIAILTSELIYPTLIHDNNAVKAQAFKCYALCCIVDNRSACYGIHIFSSALFAAANTVDTDILVNCVKAVVDLLIIYGLDLVEKSDEEEPSPGRREDEKKIFIGGTSLTDVIQALADLMNHEDLQIQEIATKGICLLLRVERVTSVSLLSRLIIKWANPATDSGSVRQNIGITLNALPTLPKYHTYCGDAIITTIKTLFNAPRTSPLSDVDFENTVKCMLRICLMSQKCSDIYTDIAFKLCSQMFDKPNAKINYIFAKTLTSLKGITMEAADDLLSLCRQLQDRIRDNQTLKYISTFIAHLTVRIKSLDPAEE